MKLDPDIKELLERSIIGLLGALITHYFRGVPASDAPASAPANAGAAEDTGNG